VPVDTDGEKKKKKVLGGLLAMGRANKNQIHDRRGGKRPREKGCSSAYGKEQKNKGGNGGHEKKIERRAPTKARGKQILPTRKPKTKKKSKTPGKP